MAKSKDKLSARQRAFVKGVAIKGNGSRAARDAGYSKATAAAQASRLLTKANIVRAVEEETKKVLEKAELKAEDVIKELRSLAFVKLKDAYAKDGTLLNPHDMPEDVQAAMAGLEVEEIYAGRGDSRVKIGVTKKFKVQDKVRSLELLGKYFKLFTDVQESKIDATVVTVSEAEVKAKREKILSDC